MKIDFNSIQENVIQNFKGGEKEILAKTFFDGMNRVMKASLEPGASIGLHTHDTSSEIIFVESGRGTAICDGEKEELKAGDIHYCPKGHSHTLINTGDEILKITAVVPQQ